MVRINSKRKGACFELEIAKFLSEKTGVSWFRVGVSSGARATIQGLGNGFQGDVFSEDSRFKDFVIECKSYAEFNLNDLFNDKSLFWSWVQQTTCESKGKSWVLFVKAKNKGTYLVFEPSDILNNLLNIIVDEKVLLVGVGCDKNDFCPSFLVQKIKWNDKNDRKE